MGTMRLRHTFQHDPDSQQLVGRLMLGTKRRPYPLPCQAHVGRASILGRHGTSEQARRHPAASGGREECELTLAYVADEDHAAGETCPLYRSGLAFGRQFGPGRQTGTKYLQRTLETLLDELPGGEEDLWRNEVSVLVMNNAPGEHAEFEELRRRAATGTDRFSLKARHYVTWLNNPGLVADPTPDAADPDDLHNPDDRPGRQVRKQTCDLIALLRHAAPLSRYYFFMEDDFEVCPFALRALHTAAVKANAQRESKGWVALRVSYGMNGVLMHNADIPDLVDYLWRHVTRKPPDLLWAEWVALQARARPPRPYAVYRYNVLNHLGAISSFAVRPDRPGWPGCWAPMSSVWSLALSERYNRRCRDVSDVSPCATRPRGRASLRDQRGLPLEPDGLEPWMSHQVNWTAPVLPRT
ncbi:Alpha-1,3-mannosyl-glycoprotein 4-beta-N-acetylglucosaminyltransferase C [Auxenochlorella protothecoides]|uniref:Alpha-1,3-mannosyl-glycoprotein 4-beta-N-acetylglucosaminyltransferase C n=2 Tax=Auxenochlorella protothecoides TaxID=3075 RepID=A0A087SUD1_AUXPR|nr:Alpha-1,3-mannosyl-glycoprotein 4-beta-N-acetylglucosaminyltransferase C [Auxenochlorella protothecoides]KFM29335.1 Alpha-1,3-mannosyl-glycoprotein 4-beta-N-acetylglucosaminyltransferase C [Auxenochlorella protothecoides]